MFVVAYEPYVKNDTNAHVTVSSWRRVDDNVIRRGKVADLCQFGADQDRCKPLRVR